MQAGYEGAWFPNEVACQIPQIQLPGRDDVRTVRFIGIIAWEKYRVPCAPLNCLNLSSSSMMKFNEIHTRFVTTCNVHVVSYAFLDTTRGSGVKVDIATAAASNEDAPPISSYLHII